MLPDLVDCETGLVGLWIASCQANFLGLYFSIHGMEFGSRVDDMYDLYG